MHIYIFLNPFVVLGVLEITFLRDTATDSIVPGSVRTHPTPKPFRYRVFNRPVCRTTRRWPYPSTLSPLSVKWFTRGVTDGWGLYYCWRKRSFCRNRSNEKRRFFLFNAQLHSRTRLEPSPFQTKGRFRASFSYCTRSRNTGN